MSQDDTAYMRRAMAMAEEGHRQAGAGSIGSIIVRDGTILAESFNEVVRNRDPTAHAEIVAIRRACARVDSDELRGATLYTTLQPCGMCAMACIWAKLGRIVYGAEDTDVHPMYFEDRHTDTMRFIRDAFRRDITYAGGVLGQECAKLYAAPDADVPESRQVNL